MNPFEKFRRERPIRIEKVKGGYHVFVHGKPVIQAEKGLAYANGRPLTPAEEALPPKKFKTQVDAFHVAHHVGRYKLNLGDFVDTYVEVVGFKPR